MKIKFYTMDHRGGLDQAITTLTEITIADAEKIWNHYQLYCYDERIGAVRLILKNIEKDYKKYPVWLLEVDNIEKFNNITKK